MLFKPTVEFQRIDKLRQATQPLFLVCRIAGVVPCDNDFFVTVPRLWYSVLVGSVVIFTSVFFKVVENIFVDKMKASSFSVILACTRDLPFSIFIFSHILSLVLYRKNFQKLLSGLKELTDVKDRYFFSTYALWYVFLKKIPPLVIHVYRNGFTLYFTMQLIPSTVADLVITVFCLSLELIRHQFKQLVTGMQPNLTNLIPLTVRHHRCIELTSLINDLFSWQLLIACTIVFINLVISVYDCIVCLQTGDYMDVLNAALACTRQVVLLFFLAYSCEETKDKADNFNNILFNMMRESKELCGNEKLHLYVTMKQTIHFSASGFFYIGYPLVTSILAAATTYLVILVQFNLEG